MESKTLKLIFANTECPICFCFTSPPVNQCYNGHLICNQCVSKVDLCPVCREEMPTKSIRNLIFEQIMEAAHVRCVNTNCTEMFQTVDLMNDHLLGCKFRYVNWIFAHFFNRSTRYKAPSFSK